MTIPKTIWTIWLNDRDEMSKKMKECLETHRVKGYEHNFITLDNLPEVNSKYFAECLESKNWAKAVDYLRVWVLNEHGGIYLDADVEIIGSFDKFLNDKMFVGEEENGFVSNAIIGSVPAHPILKDFLGKVDRNFKGDGDMVFQPGMFLWTEIIKYSNNVKIYVPEYFLPYNHHTGQLKITNNTVTIHYFEKTWIGNNN